MINFPNGYIIETEKPQDAFLVYGELNNTGFVAKGFRLNVPNLSHSGWGQKNELFLHLQSYLARLDSGRRIQFRYKRDSNYRRILDKYDADTERFSDLPFAREFRNRISAQFRKEMENHELRREYLTLYLSRPAKEFISGALDVNSEKAMNAFTEKVTGCFESEFLLLKSAFTFPVEKLTSLELFEEFFSSVNKSITSDAADFEKLFTPNFAEIYQNEYSAVDHSGIDRNSQTVTERGYGMYGDGMYHNILTLK